MVLSDDITSPCGSVELLRLTLSKLLLSLAPGSPGPAPATPPSSPQSPAVAPGGAPAPGSSVIELHCCSLQLDNQLYNRASFHFPVLLCQDQRGGGGAEPSAAWTRDANPSLSPEALSEFRRCCFLQLRMVLAEDRCSVEEVGV